ncbi:MAG: diguanylate cyclase [Acidiferrobacterales bacterium]|nr:diguanylate cyclase [Acidiferrobacterales bacterium]
MSATPADNDLIQLIQNQLEGLKKTPDGLFLHRMIDRGLQKRGGNYTGDTGRDFVNFLHGLLQRYATNPDGDTVTRVKVRLLQQRLAPHILDDATASKPAVPDTAGDSVVEAQETVESSDNDSDYSVDFSTSEATDQAVPDVAANDSNDAAEDEFVSMADDGLTEDEPAFTFEEQDEEVFDLDLSEEEGSSEDEIDFGFVEDQEDSGAKQHRAHSSESKNAGDIESSAKQDKSATGTSGSRHEIDIDVEDSLDISSLEALEGEPDESAVARDFFEKVDEIEEAEPVDFGADFNLELPSDEPEPDIIVGEITTPVPEQPTSKVPAQKSASKPSSAVASSDDIHDSSRERVDRLHETFASKLADSVTRNKNYTSLLRSNLKALKLADQPDDVLDIKQLLIRGLEDLLQGNETLNKDLGATNHYLKISQLDRNLLKDELGRARDQSLVDDLTGLQNSKAFNKQLAAEIGRSKRYGFSLALALVILDDYDELQQLKGKEAGKEVLRTFAQQILTGFRGYDAVARLNNHQFGILFPNTQKEGALSALEKAQKRAADTVIQVGGTSLRMPSFTSSLTLYSPGDQPEAIMKRTYDALALASQSTRNKIIVALAQT